MKIGLQKGDILEKKCSSPFSALSIDAEQEKKKFSPRITPLKHTHTDLSYNSNPR